MALQSAHHDVEHFDKLFAQAGVPGDLVLPVERPGCGHIYNQFVIRTSKRDALQRWLSEHEVGNEVYYPQPMHLQEAFSDWGYKKGQFPESERAAAECLAIPVYPELTAAMQERVVEVIQQFFKREKS